MKIEKLPENGIKEMTNTEHSALMWIKLNELIDAVNKLKEKE